MHSDPEKLKTYLDELVDQYERAAFISDDPISFPHAFDDPADQEVIGLFAAILAWGKRSILLNKLEDLLERMSYQPARFVTDFHVDRDTDKLSDFKHRTFQPHDAISLTLALQAVIKTFGSVEQLFHTFVSENDVTIESGIQGLSDTLSEIVPDTPVRLRKHLARPSTGSACKRLAMYTRWMVRSGPVDIGIWKSVLPNQLVLPLDVHTGRQARHLGLLSRKQDDWKAVLELTARCRAFSPNDPARYDLALFGLGAYEGREILQTESPMVR